MEPRAACLAGKGSLGRAGQTLRASLGAWDGASLVDSEEELGREVQGKGPGLGVTGRLCFLSYDTTGWPANLVLYVELCSSVCGPCATLGSAFLHPQPTIGLQAWTWESGLASLEHGGSRPQVWACDQSWPQDLPESLGK